MQESSDLAPQDRRTEHCRRPRRAGCGLLLRLRLPNSDPISTKHNLNFSVSYGRRRFFVLWTKTCCFNMRILGKLNQAWRTHDLVDFSKGGAAWRCTLYVRPDTLGCRTMSCS